MYLLMVKLDLEKVILCLAINQIWVKLFIIGLVPKISNGLFQIIEDNEDTICEVNFSMLEIYNEKI